MNTVIKRVLCALFIAMAFMFAMICGALVDQTIGIKAVFFALFITLVAIIVIGLLVFSITDTNE